MMLQLRRRGTVLAMAITAVLIAVLGLGFATPALAEGETKYQPDQAKLTKVIVAPAGTDASNDTYVFHFAGGGKVEGVEEKDKNGNTVTNLYSDGVLQDDRAIKDGDIVPTIPDVTLRGIELTNTNTLSNGKVSQTVVQKPLSEILNDIVFPHAGVYTYVVTEQLAASDGMLVIASQAEYILRVYVSNKNTGTSSSSGNKALFIDGVTVQRTKDDIGGGDGLGKVDATYPKTDNNGKIQYIGRNNSGDVAPATDKLAGDDRGCKVPGFTFANEYIKGGSFKVTKLYDGDHSDRTKYSTVELAVYSAAAVTSDGSAASSTPDGKGRCLTYKIEGDGIDKSENKFVLKDASGNPRKLDGVNTTGINQVNDTMAFFNKDGWVVLKADLKEGSSIRITGEFGPYNDASANGYPDGNKRMILSNDGLLSGETYFVIERDPYDYRPEGYIHTGAVTSGTTLDPRKSSEGMTKIENKGNSPDKLNDSEYINPEEEYQIYSLWVKGYTTSDPTTVFVVNKLDENKVSPTGIFIDNLPYILMVGIPVAVFAVMFANRLRKNVAA